MLFAAAFYFANELTVATKRARRGPARECPNKAQGPYRASQDGPRISVQRTNPCAERQQDGQRQSVRTASRYLMRQCMPVKAASSAALGVREYLADFGIGSYQLRWPISWRGLNRRFSPDASNSSRSRNSFSRASPVTLYQAKSVKCHS